MTKPWTYLSLKAVIEYMDVNKRLELNSHCPALRSVELSVLLILKSLTLEKERIVVNDVCYKVKSTERMKTILDGRKEVRVEFLKIRNSSVLPDNLKIRTRSLDSGDIDLEVDKEKHQKAKRMVDRAGEIVKRIHELMETIAKKSNNVKENSTSDEKVGADQGERGENLALSVGTAFRWFIEGCRRNAAVKRSVEVDEEDEEPRVKSVKKREVEDVPGRYESSGWAKNIQMCADLFKK
ncbi:hypothetical protein CRE_09606 [Caenorhabditis remanei]|uniref:Uncharacterized protein n=1 Tax=Caenorhabditis remanei TaxID=31234 RepID=E3MJ93_CAERE|nr:hypothetical protein CRE_09606 [Caenorhabditis remanei]